MIQLICHLIGDYVLQNQAMADRKTRSSLWALIHATFYMLPFFIVSLVDQWTGGSNPALFVLSFPAFMLMWSTHFVIDRWRLAGYWVSFWGIGSYDSTIGRLTGFDASRDAFVLDDDQERPLKAGERVLISGGIGTVDGTAARDFYYVKLPGPLPQVYAQEGTGLTRLKKKQTPPFLAIWLLILVDNTAHLTINWLALTFL